MKILVIALIGALPATATFAQDIVVYGGTPGGIAAAVCAARMGRVVTLVEYQNHIGGMTTSGLGKSDIENRAMIGGLFAEFVSSIHEHYVKTYGADHENVKRCHDGYYFEPSVAERVFEEMLQAEPNLRLLKGWRLRGAHTRDGRVTEISIIHRGTNESRTVTGKVFIDASYEGDLYAAAGASYRLGRESRAEFGEPHAGVVYFEYQDKKFLEGTTGEADDRLPAYTYRLCLTTDPDNAYPLTEAPADYDRNLYLGYFEDLKAGRLAGPKVFKPGRGYNPAHFDTLVRALSVTDIPNGKTDVNINPRPLAFPFAEENQDYVEGDEATRQRIRDRHRNLTLGLLWFLQHDPEVPETHRGLANELHLPKDEFADNGHFPFQLYVREARRLMGEYTLTEHDITGDGEERKSPRRHADSIAVGEFPIDSFPCRKRQPTDTVVLEGYLGMLDHITRPYEIPYRIMIPEKLDGVIVPVAASTTHVAFSSIRMEPTWMALGQAAGVAAHLAIEHNIAPRKVSIHQLQQLLREQGQVLHHAAPAGGLRLASQESPPEAPKPSAPKPSTARPSAPIELLNLPGSGTVPEAIDFENLPRLRGDLAVVNSVALSPDFTPDQTLTMQFMRLNLHNYLAHYDGKFWCIWSDGPRVEDWPTQEVKYATSEDGLHWSKAKSVTGTPEEPYAFIARGLWVRDGQLLALAAHYRGKGAFGVNKELELWAYGWNPQAEKWEFVSKVYDDAINNFPPEKLPDGNWITTRRDSRFNVTILIGGKDQLDKWEAVPVVGVSEVKGFRPDEPILWLMPGNRLTALFRDNVGSSRLYQATSGDLGRTWSTPVRSNFPNSTSKIFSLQTSRGYRLMISNANVKLARRELHLSVSKDGSQFTRMAKLDIPAPAAPRGFESIWKKFAEGIASLQYPHAIEHNGHLYIALSRCKLQTEVFRVSLDSVDELLK